MLWHSLSTAVQTLLLYSKLMPTSDINRYIRKSRKCLNSKSPQREENTAAVWRIPETFALATTIQTFHRHKQEPLLLSGKVEPGTGSGCALMIRTSTSGSYMVQPRSGSRQPYHINWEVSHSPSAGGHLLPVQQIHGAPKRLIPFLSVHFAIKLVRLTVSGNREYTQLYVFV